MVGAAWYRTARNRAIARKRGIEQVVETAFDVPLLPVRVTYLRR
jgi:hypothetical protein